MNICFVSEDYDQRLGGVAVNAITLAERLSALGHELTVVTSRPTGLPAREIVNGVEVHRTRSLRMPRIGFYFSIAAPGTIRQIFRERGVELVHFHTATPLTKHAYAVAKELGLPRIYTFNALPEHFSSNSVVGTLFGPLIWRGLIALCNGCDLTICPSVTLRRQLIRRGITTPIAPLSNAMGFERMSAAERGPDASSFVVLFVGRLMEEKGIPLLIRAFHQLSARHEDAELWIVGTGYLRKRLQALCVRLGVDARVKFLGFIAHDDLGRYYSLADVLVLPSTVETQGMVAIEAMYFAKPIIVTRTIVSANELVRHGQNGFIVGRSVDELAAALIALSEDRELRTRLGEASKLRSAGFETDGIVSALQALYEDVLAAARAGGRALNYDPREAVLP